MPLICTLYRFFSHRITIFIIKYPGRDLTFKFLLAQTISVKPYDLEL